MKIRDVDLGEFVDIFYAQLMAANDASYLLNWSVEIVGRTFSFRFDRSFDTRGPVITRRIQCDEWSVHTEMLDATYADANVQRVVFSGDDQRFMSDMIAFKMMSN